MVPGAIDRGSHYEPVYSTLPRTLQDENTDDGTWEAHLVVLDSGSLDHVRDTCSVHESRDVPPDLVEAQDQVLGHGPRKLSLALITEDDDGDILLIRGRGTERSSGDLLPGPLRNAAVDSTAETPVARYHDPEGLLVGVLGYLVRLGFGEDLAVGLSVGLGVLHRPLGFRESGGCDHLEFLAIR